MMSPPAFGTRRRPDRIEGRKRTIRLLGPAQRITTKSDRGRWSRSPRARASLVCVDRLRTRFGPSRISSGGPRGVAGSLRPKDPETARREGGTTWGSFAILLVFRPLTGINVARRRRCCPYLALWGGAEPSRMIGIVLGGPAQPGRHAGAVIGLQRRAGRERLG